MLVFSNVAIRRGGRTLLSTLDMRIHPGQKVGLTGANGTGKSSLFALIMGQLDADEGSFSLPAKWQIAHVKQETPHTDISALQYTLQGDIEYTQLQSLLETAIDSQLGELHARLEAIDGYTAQSRAARLLHGLGFDQSAIERPVSSFSGGWRMRLNLAQALMCRSDLLLLDEPTNHLDLDAVIWLQNWLKAYSGTLLLISHDREFLDGTVDHIAHIERQKLVLYTGNYSAFEKARSEQLSQQQAAYQKQQREIAHMQSFVERFRAKATKARQAQSRLKALQRMQTIAPAHVDSPFTLQFFKPEKLPDRLFMTQHTDLGYANQEGRLQPIVKELKLDVLAGDRIGLIGPNGSGKSTIIKYLSGELKAIKEDAWRAKDLQIGYFAQHQLEQLQPQHSALEHVRQLDQQASEQQLRDFLGGFGFQGDRVTEPVAPFSGGEKARLALALIIYTKPNLLLLDEPTNHLDLEMRHALTIALQEYAGAMVIVSHDRHLLKTVTDELIMVSHGHAKPYEGDLDDYSKWLQERARQYTDQYTENQQSENTDKNNQDSAPETAPSRKEQRRLEAARRQQLQPLKNQVTSLEKQVNALETEKQQLELQLADSELYIEQNKQQLQAVLAKKQQVDTRLASVEAQWLEAMECYEAAQMDT